MSDRLITITSAEDPRVSAYKNIRERDLVGRQGLFIAEGKSVLAVLVEHQRTFGIQSIFILENRLGSVENILADVDPKTPIYVASREVMDELAGFAIHRGILAVGVRPNKIDQPPTTEASQRWQTIIAVSALANHDNVGGIFRNAAALGADAVLMDAATCDPFYRKAIRVSVGGVFKVPMHRFETTLAMHNWLDENAFSTFAFTPKSGQPLETWRAPDKTAVLFGAEGPGLGPDLLGVSNTLSIAMDAGMDSLNVATTSALALFHIRQTRK
ncbi:MAG: RNA methyltransferase [Pseudomonadota bacterium]